MSVRVRLEPLGITLAAERGTPLADLLFPHGVEFPCGGRGTCTLADPSSCGDAEVCESVQGEETPRCFAPLVVEGRVFDLSSDTAIEGASVTAVDENGASAGQTVQSAADGSYSLREVVGSRQEDHLGVGRRLQRLPRVHTDGGDRVALRWTGNH